MKLQPNSQPCGGGICSPRDLPYSPPVGPKGIDRGHKVGLGGTNYGNCGTQGKHSVTASVGGSVSAGMNHGNSPTQRG